MRKNTRIIDANPLIRLALRDIKEQAEIVENLVRKALKSEVTLTSEVYVLTEINNVLKFIYDLDKNTRCQVLKATIELPIKFGRKEQLELGLHYFAFYNLDLEDCLLLAKAKVEDEALFTFDAKLKAIAKKLDIKRMP